MKRIKILFLVAILSVMNVCAQSFKVKKGELQIDGTPVAKFEKKDGKFVFSDLSNNLLFRAFLTEETAQGNTAPHRWIEFSNANGVIREVEIPDKVKFTFSGEKYFRQSRHRPNHVARPGQQCCQPGRPVSRRRPMLP